MKDRHLYSVACTWHGSFKQAGRVNVGFMHFPCCPHCKAPLLQIPEHLWTKQKLRKKKMRDFYAWLNAASECWPSLWTGSMRYFIHTGRFVEITTN